MWIKILFLPGWKHKEERGRSFHNGEVEFYFRHMFIYCELLWSNCQRLAISFSFFTHNISGKRWSCSYTLKYIIHWNTMQLIKGHVQFNIIILHFCAVFIISSNYFWQIVKVHFKSIWLISTLLCIEYIRDYYFLVLNKGNWIMKTQKKI